MDDDDPRVPPQSPYRRSAQPPDERAPRDVSAGFVACMVLLIVVLVKALSAEPSHGENCGSAGGWRGSPHARGGHHR
jgi:hypothetical protein